MNVDLLVRHIDMPETLPVEFDVDIHLSSGFFGPEFRGQTSTTAKIERLGK